MSDFSFFKIDSNSVLSKGNFQLDVRSKLTIPELCGNLRIDEHRPQVLTSELVHVDHALARPPVRDPGFLFRWARSIRVGLLGQSLHRHHVSDASRADLASLLGHSHSFLL